MKFSKAALQYLCVVYVVIKQKNSTKDIIAHAILNSCSQGTFISVDLVDVVSTLDTDGITTFVIVKMLNGKSQLKPKLVDVLAISNSSDQKSWINLPHCHMKKKLPVDLEDIPTPEKLRRWHYLQPLASETVQSPFAHVCAFVGANCLQELEATEFIRSDTGDSYTYKTKLG